MKNNLQNKTKIDLFGNKIVQLWQVLLLDIPQKAVD
jgi:hypothetical protein